MAHTWDVPGMIRQMPASLFNMWRVYDELEPFGPEREDYRAASIVQALWNIARDTKAHPNGWPLTDFVLRFGDAPSLAEDKPQQSSEQMEHLIDAWIAGSNAIFNARAAKQAAAETVNG